MEHFVKHSFFDFRDDELILTLKAGARWGQGRHSLWTAPKTAQWGSRCSSLLSFLHDEHLTPLGCAFLIGSLCDLSFHLWEMMEDCGLKQSLMGSTTAMNGFLLLDQCLGSPSIACHTPWCSLRCAPVRFFHTNTCRGTPGPPVKARAKATSYKQLKPGVASSTERNTSP